MLEQLSEGEFSAYGVFDRVIVGHISPQHPV
jgi:hypothetical protein